MNLPSLVERHAVQLLTGVGGDTEWWWHSPGLIGHLRVPITATENQSIPAGCAIHDAGETGTQRPRTRR